MILQNENSRTYVENDHDQSEIDLEYYFVQFI